MLEDHSDLLPLLTQLLFPQRLHRAAVDDHIAGTLRFKLIDNSYQSRLASAGITDDAIDLAILNLQADAVDSVDIVFLGREYLDNILQFNHACPPFLQSNKSPVLREAYLPPRTGLKSRVTTLFLRCITAADSRSTIILQSSNGNSRQRLLYVQH